VVTPVVATALVAVATAGCSDSSGGIQAKASRAGLTQSVPLSSRGFALEATPVRLSGSLTAAATGSGTERKLSIRWRIHNTGVNILAVDPVTESALVDGAGTATRGAMEPTQPDTGERPPPAFRLGPGESALASVPYLVPATAAVRTVRFGLLQRSGAAPVFGAAQWPARQIPTHAADDAAPAPPPPLLPPTGSVTLRGVELADKPTSSETSSIRFNNVRLTATLRRVVDPVQPQNPSYVNTPGRHLAAVQFDIRNVGTTPCWIVPDLVLFDTQGQAYGASLTAYSELGTDTTSATLRPGANLAGLTTIRVRDGAMLSYVRYALSSGNAGAVARWRLR
jgi:hypothetical protein